MEDFSDRNIEENWEKIRSRLLVTPLTKKRATHLKKIWKKYTSSGNWKLLIQDIDNFLSGKGMYNNIIVEQFEESKLKLITIDFIS